MKRRMLYIITSVCFVFLGIAAWKLTRMGYESADYSIVESDGSIEIRDYPDLVLAATNSTRDLQGRDGSFMRLFRYISGANEGKQKIAMTTPVFMESDVDGGEVSMGFVMPKKYAEQQIPQPQDEGVKIQERDGGRFAVIRFAGELNAERVANKEQELREWLATKNLVGAEIAEAAGYDPPFTPGPLRRNEVLIRLVSPREQGFDDE